MLAIVTTEEFLARDREGRWAARRAARDSPVLRAVLRAFVARGGPVPVADVVAAFPAAERPAAERALADLDRDDLVHVVDGRIETAYPLSARPTPFAARPAGGAVRYACCALDALGVAPMVGRPVRVESRCHHDGEPLAFDVTPAGPGPEASKLMVWLSPPCEGERRVITGL